MVVLESRDVENRWRVCALIDGIESMSNDTTRSLTPEGTRIVVGVDGSPCAFRALEYAAEQAANTGSILQIVTVYNEFPGLNPFGPVLDQEKARALVRAAIDKVHESHPEVVTSGKTGNGVAGSVLSDASEEASELVFGTRGHGQIVGAVLGSVSEYVIHHAHCTTAVVH